MIATAIFTMLLVSCSGEKQNSPPIKTIDVGKDSRVSEDTDSTLDEGKIVNNCREYSPWKNGKKAFVNRTEESALGAIRAVGARISAVDFNGDGKSDIFIRSAKGDDFAGTRTNWLLQNMGDGTFKDVTQSSGIAASRTDTMKGRPVEVVAFADVDNDGDIDVVSAFTNDGSSPHRSEIMLNDGQGVFTFGADNLPFQRENTTTTIGGMSWTDFDRDGLIDLWIGHGPSGDALASDQLYQQQANGTFKNVSTIQGVRSEDWTLGSLNAGRAHTNAWSTAVCDLNNDGNPDLLAASYGRAPNMLYENDGNHFSNISISSGYAFDERVDWRGNESAKCWCKLHPQDEGCDGIALPNIRCEADGDAFRWRHNVDREAFRLGGNSGTTVCGDIDNDGDLDLLTTEIVHWDVGQSSDPSELLINTGEASLRFERPGNETTGLVREHTISDWNDGDITGALFDFDNDGRLDVYIGSTSYAKTRALLFHQKEDGRFEAVPIEGLDQKSAHGVGIADFDGDGDLDIVLGHARFRCSTGDHCYESAHVRYFENVVGQDANWVQIRLEGKEGTNRSAIGARITLESEGLMQVREIGGGHGHYGIQHEMVAHFGLGKGCSAMVKIRWPNKELSEQEIELDAGFRYVVREGEAPEKE